MMIGSKLVRRGAGVVFLLVMATLAQRWRFSLEPSPPVELQPVITLRPRFGMPVRAHRLERR